MASLVPELGQHKALWNTNIRPRPVGRVKVQNRYKRPEISLEGTVEAQVEYSRFLNWSLRPLVNFGPLKGVVWMGLVFMRTGDNSTLSQGF